MIIVTDAQTDVDDVGAITVGANSGSRVYGLVSTTNRQSVADTLMVLDKHYGLEAWIGLDRRGDPGSSTRDPYSSALPREYPTGRNRVVEANKALRQALRDARRDGERIPIVSIGSAGTLDRFLNPASDRHRERHRALIRDAVSGLFVMAGNFESGASEFNVRLDPGAAQRLAEQWPTRITYAGFELGRDLLTGEVLRDRPGPTRRAYQLYPRQGSVENKQSYDLIAVAAALGAPGLEVSRRGRVTFGADGTSDFTPQGGNRRFLRFVNQGKLKSWINKRLR